MTMAGAPSIPPLHEVVAPGGWHTVDLISDLHLQPQDPATHAAWLGYLQTTPADALIILGDLFEAWVGDDAAREPGSFEAQCAQALQAAAQRLPVFLMHGNRDFLIGEGLAAQCGLTLLPDPTVLVLHGTRWLLSHGDALCLEDVGYLRFRAQVRRPEWQQAVLARPLAERRAMARQMRAESEQQQAGRDAPWADVDTQAARDWLHAAHARTLIHGHTHRPATHDLGEGLQRIVLSDWDVAAHPPRAQALTLTLAGPQRVDLR